jgi:hypothetical protein
MSHTVRAAGGGRKKKDALIATGDQSLTRVAPPPELRNGSAVQIWKSQSKLMIGRGTLVRFLYVRNLKNKKGEDCGPSSVNYKENLELQK